LRARTRRSPPGSKRVEAVVAIDAEFNELRTDYERKRAALRDKRESAVQRSAQRLAAVASLIGDDSETARLLGLPRHRMARACSLALGSGRRPSALAAGQNSVE
jgi:hypothetical protein